MSGVFRVSSEWLQGQQVQGVVVLATVPRPSPPAPGRRRVTDNTAAARCCSTKTLLSNTHSPALMRCWRVAEEGRESCVCCRKLWPCIEWCWWRPCWQGLARPSTSPAWPPSTIVKRASSTRINVRSVTSWHVYTGATGLVSHNYKQLLASSDVLPLQCTRSLSKGWALSKGSHTSLKQASKPDEKITIIQV